MANRKHGCSSRLAEFPLATALVLLVPLFVACGCGSPARPLASSPPPLNNVQHIFIVMQENHSFDNYYGALPYVPGGPYHAPTEVGSACPAKDNRCVDGLTCLADILGGVHCSNSNVASDGSTIYAHHDNNYCVKPDLDHTWHGSHREANYSDPNSSASTSDGFVRVNEKEEGNLDDTMGYYNQKDLPYYYALAQTFAMSDSNFCDLIGPTSPNRFFSLAGTSFGHIVTQSDDSSSGDAPPPGGYKPINGTLFDLLDAHGIHWSEYFDAPAPGTGEDVPSRPYGHVFRPTSPNYLPMAQLYTDAAAGTLAQVVWIDLKADEHPPADIRAGQQEVAQIISAIRSSPVWSSSVLFFTYDEHGGAYDHVRPPTAIPPDDVFPGLCEDLSNPPHSLQPGGGASCTDSFTEAQSICPALPPEGPFPADCAAFGQLGIRVPFVAISPFAKPAYVSHVVSDHTSILAFIEKRFMPGVHLTNRDATASTLEDMFDFQNSPSLKSNVPASLAEPPAPDHNCSD